MKDEQMAEMISDIPRDIAVTIKRLRTDRGLSQEALAAKMRGLGLDSWRQTTVAKVEAATAPRALSLQEVVGLAVALGIGSLDQLLSPELEATMFAQALDADRAAVEAALDAVRTSDLWEKLGMDDSQSADLEAVRSALTPDLLSGFVDDLKQRKLRLARDRRQP